MAGTDALLSTFDVDDMATEALLFQTGYLTIRDHKRLGGRTVYRLGYPNQEVRQSLNDSLSRHLAGDSTRQMANSIRLYELLEANDFAGLKTLFMLSTPASPTSGTPTTTSRASRATTRACSIPTSRGWAWT